MALIKTLGFIINHPININNKISALIRFLHWQISSIITKKRMLYEWVDNSRLLIQKGDAGLTGNIYCGLHEYQDMAFVLHVLNSEDLFIDVGANMGSYTVLSSAVIGADTISYEPVPRVYERLIDNIYVNKINNKVHAYNIAIGNEESTIEFTSDMNCINHVIADGEITNNSIKVNVTTLDKELSKLEPNLIKIDVEGYETLVLQGASHILGKESVYAVLLELNGSGNRYGFEDSRIHDLMCSSGYKAYKYDPVNKELIFLEKNMSTGNTLYIKNYSKVLERINTTNKYLIHGVYV